MNHGDERRRGKAKVSRSGGGECCEEEEVGRIRRKETRGGRCEI